PTADLALSTDYYVEIAPTAIQDKAGNPYTGISGNTTWNFKTVDAPPAIPPVNLFLSQTTGSEAGTTSITVTATAAAAVIGDQTLDLVLSGDASLADFIAPVPNKITIPNGSSSGQVTFTIVHDHLDEIDETATLTISNPSAGIVLGPDITDSFTIIDNDSAGFQIQPISGNTSEAGGQANFDLRLLSQPSADVSLSFSSSNTAEGTVAPTTVTFTPANWNSYQTITATGVDDLAADGDQSYKILSTPVISADSTYNNYKLADVDVINTDNDIPGVTITQSGGSTNLTEAGKTDTYEIQLNTQPLGNVEVTLTSDAQAEISLDGVNFAPSQIVNFTPTTGITPQTITVRAIDDGVAEHNHSSSITHAITKSTAPNYPTTRPIGAVNAQIVDNDITYNVIGSSTQIAEGNTGSQVVSFTISRDGETQQASSVDFSLGGTASVGTDYNNVLVSGSGVSATGSKINFAPNATTATIAVEILGDTVVEANETLELSLSNGNTAGTTTIT
ncbi:Calx-beta domain-containing protein, partial [Planktothrix paucivesiculata]